MWINTITDNSENHSVIIRDIDVLSRNTFRRATLSRILLMSLLNALHLATYVHKHIQCESRTEILDITIMIMSLRRLRWFFNALKLAFATLRSDRCSKVRQCKTNDRIWRNNWVIRYTSFLPYYNRALVSMNYSCRVAVFTPKFYKVPYLSSA